MLEKTRLVIAMLGGIALAPALQAQDPDALYRGWSAEEMLDTQVRGPDGGEVGQVEDLIVGADGSLRRLVVRAGGVIFGLGATHIGVPWGEVRIGPDMQYVQVPVTEENHRGYPLYDGRDLAAGNWRVRELIHDIARLEDEPFYGRVHDVVFDESGRARWVIVDRRTGRWGAAGPYAHPFTGYRPGSAYDVPDPSANLSAYPRFDYFRLGELSRFSRAGGAAAGQSR